MELKSISSAYKTLSYDSVTSNNKKPKANHSSNSASEFVVISEDSLNLKKIKDAVDEAPEIRLPIVEMIKEKIRNNSYPIDLSLESALEVLQKYKIL